MRFVFLCLVVWFFDLWWFLFVSLVWFALVFLFAYFVCGFSLWFCLLLGFGFLITKSVEYYLGLHIDFFLTMYFQGLPVTSYRSFDRCLEIGLFAFSLK